nr:hypothetical protein GCM10020063_053220 [Dactylosporangium thailandense]
MTGTHTLVAAATPDRPPHRPNRLLRAGLVAGPVFIAAFLTERTFRAAGDWVQVAAFVVTGLLGLAFALGLRRALRPGPGALAAPLLVAVWSVGLIGAGAFPTRPTTRYGWLFIALAAIMFVLAYAYARRRRPHTARRGVTATPGGSR